MFFMMFVRAGTVLVEMDKSKTWLSPDYEKGAAPQANDVTSVVLPMGVPDYFDQRNANQKVIQNYSMLLCSVGFFCISQRNLFCFY